MSIKVAFLDVGNADSIVVLLPNNSALLIGILSITAGTMGDRLAKVW